MARRAGGTGWAAWIQGTLGGIEFLQGNLEAAETLTRAALDDAHEAGDQPLVGSRHAELARVLLCRGMAEQAAEELGRARAILDVQPEPQLIPLLRWLEGQLALDAGDEERGVAALWASAEALAGTSVDLDPRGNLDLVRLLVRRGDGDGARRARDVLAAGASPFARALLQVADGLLADDPDEAVRILRRGRRTPRCPRDPGRPRHRAARPRPGGATRRGGREATFERARALFEDVRRRALPARGGGGADRIGGSELLGLGQRQPPARMFSSAFEGACSPGRRATPSMK